MTDPKSALSCPNGHKPQFVIRGDWRNPTVQCVNPKCEYKEMTIGEWNALPRVKLDTPTMTFKQALLRASAILKNRSAVHTNDHPHLDIEAAAIITKFIKTLP